MLWRQPAQAGLTDDTMQHAVGGTIRLAAFWRLSDRALRSFVTRPPGPERVMFLGEYLGSQLSARCVSNKTMLSIRLASTGRKQTPSGRREGRAGLRLQAYPLKMRTQSLFFRMPLPATLGTSSSTTTHPFRAGL